MRIALIGPANPYRGGIAKFYDTLAENMHRLGHTIMIANFSMQYPSFLFPGKTQYTTETEIPYPNCRTINSISPISWLKTANKVIEFNPEIVVFRYWMPFMSPSFGTIAKFIRKKGIKTIAIADNIIPHEKHFFDKCLTNYFLRNIDRVICMSKKVENELKEMDYSRDVSYNPHPLYNSYGPMVERNEACGRLALDPSKSYTMFFGFIREYKGLDILLKAWALTECHKSQKLIIAGEFYSNEEKYIELIDSLDIRNSIILRTKYIPEEEVSLYFSVADLIVQPYRSASQSGISGIAYNYCIPMVVTEVGGLVEYVTDKQEGFVTSVDEKSIAEAIDKYYHENLKESFSKNMKKRVKEFSWENMIDCIIGQ